MQVGGPCIVKRYPGYLGLSEATTFRVDSPGWDAKFTCGHVELKSAERFRNQLGLACGSADPHQGRSL